MKKSRGRTAGTGGRRSRRLGHETLEQRAMLSLTHHYTFNDGDAADLVGGADGVLHNGATVVDGALYLQNSGVNSGQSSEVQHVQLPADILPNEGGVTIEVWYASASAPNWARVFDFGNQIGGAGDSYLFFSHQSGANDSRATFRRSSLSEVVVSGDTTDDGSWHVAAVTIGETDRMLRLYLDGVEQGAIGIGGRGGGVSTINDTLNYLGRSLFDSDPGFSGLIDELRIYDEALSAGELASHAALGASVVVVAGDYDGDGDVDSDDRTVWANTFGSVSDLQADGNNDGVVNAADYTVWRDNLGAGVLAPPDQVLDDESLTTSALRDTVIELIGESELHITSNRGALTGSEIRLNSPDAWLYLHGFAPSEVASSYLSQVRVDGAAALPGLNVRVVQYENGTVVIPQTPGFEPLEAFTGVHFTGDSAAFEQYTYYDTPGEFGVLDGDLSSFKLKRGYMATLATESDGGGFSQVYVAQDHDLEVSLLAEGFEDEVRFLRVLPWRWVAKKGASDLSPVTLDAAWFYNWNNSEQSTLDYEYVPIKQQLHWPANPTNNTEVTHWLGFNEPNNPVEDAYTSLGNGSVDNAVAFYSTMQTTGHRIGSPAVTDGGKAWLYEFMDKALAQGLRIDYIAIHNYQANHSASSLQSWLKDVYDRYHLPIWITEFNNGANWTGSAPPSNQANANVIASFIDMMDNTPWIERYSIYSRVEAVRELTYGDGSLTPTGQVYHDNESPIGYLQEIPEVAPSSGSSGAQLLFEGDTLDSTGYGFNGHAAGVPTYVDGVQGQAIDLDGADDRVQLPTGVASGDEFSFAGWVRWDGGGNWQRIFDFGKDTDSYMFLTPSNGGNMRFAIKNHGGEQIVQTTPLAVGEWTHVAVTLGGGQANLYVDGQLVDTNNSATLTPAQIGATKNYLGKSQFNDPYFNGQLDEVLITDYVLTQSQIAGLMTNQAPEFDASEITLGSATAGVSYNGSVAGRATDDQSVRYSKAHGPDWVTVSVGGALTGTPTTGDLGVQQVVVTATDPNGATAFTVVTIEVNAAPALLVAATSESHTDTAVSGRSRAPLRDALPAASVDRALLLASLEAPQSFDDNAPRADATLREDAPVDQADEESLEVAFATL